MITPHVLLTAVDRRRGYVDATVTPRPGQEAHRIGYLRGADSPHAPGVNRDWWCQTCDNGQGRGKRCQWIKTVQALVPPMEDQP